MYVCEERVGTSAGLMLMRMRGPLARLEIRGSVDGGFMEFSSFSGLIHTADLRRRVLIHGTRHCVVSCQLWMRIANRPPPHRQ